MKCKFSIPIHTLGSTDVINYCHYIDPRRGIICNGNREDIANCPVWKKLE